MTPQYGLRSIEKRYGKKVAVNVEELTIWPGQLYALMGPNGSGKSTLLNVLAFLTQPEQGYVEFAGERVSWKRQELNGLRRRVTLLQQSPYLFAGEVFDNVAFGLKLRRVGRDELRRQADVALEMVGLAGLQRRNVKQLSGGEARRVSLARALVLKPDVLLLDEPLANLDEESTAVIEKLMQAMPAQGTTIIMATHDAEQAKRMANKVIRLVAGEIRPSLKPQPMQ
jgi:tungstate transport system ATP-binding protein